MTLSSDDRKLMFAISRIFFDTEVNQNIMIIHFINNHPNQTILSDATKYYVSIPFSGKCDYDHDFLINMHEYIIKAFIAYNNVYPDIFPAESLQKLFKKISKIDINKYDISEIENVIHIMNHIKMSFNNEYLKELLNEDNIFKNNWLIINFINRL